MLIGNIEFPNEIIEALNNNKLVVFAGSGVSMGKPTSLPSFKKMSNRIAEGTGHKMRRNDSCENFLGNLKFQGIDVNAEAAKMLKNLHPKHNKTHEAVLQLFKDPSDIKVVTTNYDKMFEEVTEEMGISVPVYSAPAFPLGNDMKGIIHVHGSIDDPKYMVVTNEDFGKAYLTERYAARFLVKVFKTYTVLFIGYSYHDNILRYLTRAMIHENANTKFILTDDEKNNWKSLGIIPVMFPKQDFDGLQEGISKLGERVRRGFSDWKMLFNEFQDSPPQDVSLETEFEFCLSSIEKSRIMADCIYGEQWLDKLNQKKVFENIFSTSSTLTEFDRIWMNWIVDKIVGKEDFLFRKLYLQHKNRIHPDFARDIIRKLWVNESKIPNESYQCYLLLLSSYIDSSWEIRKLIKILYKQEMYEMCYELFRKYFEVTVVLEESSYDSKHSCQYRHKFTGNFYHIQTSWKCCKERFMELYAEQLLYFSKEKIGELHNIYQIARKETEKHIEPYEMSMLAIEEHESCSKENALYILADIFCESCSSLEERERVDLREFFIQCLRNPSVLLRRIALKALRKSKKLDASEKFDIFIENLSEDAILEKEQIYLLINSIFHELDEGRTDRILNEFEPHLHPDRDLSAGDPVWIPDQSPVTQEELFKLEPAELAEYLNDYEKAPVQGPSRQGLLSTFSSCVKGNDIWTLQVIKNVFMEGKIRKDDAWSHLMEGILASDYPLGKQIRFIRIFAENMDLVGDIYGLSELVLKTTGSVEFKEEFRKEKGYWYRLLRRIRDRRSREDSMEYPKATYAVYHTTLGHSLLSAMYMLSCCEVEEKIPQELKVFFEESLALQGSEKEISLCVLAGHFNCLYVRDQKWYTSRFSGILRGKDRRSFEIAWEGIFAFSYSLNRNVSDNMVSNYLMAIEHLDWLHESTRNQFIDMLVLLLIYVVEKPCLEYIPKFYKYAEEQDILRFTQKIENSLANMESRQKITWWNTWLKQHLENRYTNKPTELKENEKKSIINFLPKLAEVFGEAERIVRSGPMPKEVDPDFLRELEESKVVLQYPHETMDLLTGMLKENTQFGRVGDCLGKLYKNAAGLTEREKNDFKEVLLQRNIDLENV